jgi:hypothetical protein
MMWKAGSGARATLLTAWVICMAVGIPLVGAGLWQFSSDNRFARAARSVAGTVLSKSRTRSVARSRPVGGRSRTERFEAAYRFAVDGATFEGRGELPEAAWEKLQEGGPVEVLYDPDDPASNRLTASGSGLMNALFVLAGLVLTAAGGTGAVWTTRRAKRDAQLARHGVNARATVTEINRVPLKVNDEALWRLRFEYQDDQGHRHAGAVTVSEEDAGTWSVGDRGIVRYDPARSSESVWMGRP